MLEFLRHQTKPIMITLAVIIIIAFTFWGGSTRSGYGKGGQLGDGPVLTVLGSEYSFTDFGKLQRNFQIAEELRLPGVQNYFAYDMVGLKFTYGDKNTGMPLTVSDAPVDFAPNLVILRDALESNGVHASDDEVQQAFRALGQFQVNGQFDRDRALDYERSLEGRGIRLADVYDVIRDSLGLQKLQKIIAGNLVGSPKAASEYYTFTYQTIKAASIPFALDDYKKSAKVTDEQIAKYFEENKEDYKSPEKRAISYVLLEKPNTEGKNAEDTVKARNAFNEKIGNLASAVIAPDANFDAEAKKAGFEVKAVPAFAYDTPPDALKKESELLRAIFTNNPVTHAVSDPVEVEKGYVIFKVTSVANPAQQELKDVKDKVKETLVAQQATEAMQKAANDAKKKLEEALKAGKKFDAAAKEAGVTPQVLAEFSPAHPLTDLSNGREIAREAMLTPAGAFTKPLSTPNGVILVHVLSKEIRKSEESASLKSNIATGLDSQAQGNLFRGWFEQRYDEAHVTFSPFLLGSSSALR